MLLKKIRNPFRKKQSTMPITGHKTLTEAIKNTPEYRTKEVSIVKAGDKYYNVSKAREEKQTLVDKKLLEIAYKQKKSKIVHTHTIGPIKELPSANDIAHLCFQHYKYKKDFSAITNIDRKTGEISGTVAILVTRKTTKFIADNFSYKPITKKKNLQALQINISKKIIDSYTLAKIKATEIANAKKNKNNKVFIDIYNAELKKIMFKYFEDILGLRFRFVPNTSKGYRFNKERMAFEKI